MKRCPGCGRLLPLTEYHHNASKHDGYQSRCKRCAYERVKAYRLRLRLAREVVHVTVMELEACLPTGITGRVVGHYIDGRVVYDCEG